MLKLAREFNDVEPLRISTEKTDFTGRNIAVLGFPQQDHRINTKVFAALIGENSGRYHRMFGKILKTEATTSGTRLTYDAFTAAGVGGGPVIDLQTGKVIAIHRSGRILGEIAKLGQGLSLEKVIESPRMKERLAKSLRAQPTPLSLGLE